MIFEGVSTNALGTPPEACPSAVSSAEDDGNVDPL